MPRMRPSCRQPGRRHMQGLLSQNIYPGPDTSYSPHHYLPFMRFSEKRRALVVQKEQAETVRLRLLELGCLDTKTKLSKKGEHLEIPINKSIATEVEYGIIIQDIPETKHNEEMFPLFTVIPSTYCSVCGSKLRPNENYDRFIISIYSIIVCPTTYQIC